MLPNWGFQIIFINIIFYFLNVKNDFFCEASTQNMMQNGTHPIFTQISPYLKDYKNIRNFLPFYLISHI